MEAGGILDVELSTVSIDGVIWLGSLMAVL